MKNPFNAWSRKDFFGKQEAKGWEKALKKGRKISITTPQSSRWWIDGDDSKYYSTDEIVDSGEYDDVINANVVTGSAKGEVTEAKVNSTAIDLISYDPDTKALGIAYKGGTKEYIFPNVPKEEFEALMRAPSKGKYVQFVIKPKYSEA